MQRQWGWARRLVTIAAVTGVWGSTGAEAQVAPDTHGFVTAHVETLVPPPGSRVVRILGDPAASGPYVMRITFAPGTGTRPHFHEQARYITVIDGTWWVARGPEAATYDADEMTPVRAGGFLYQPPRGIHYDEARDGPVTVQISGIGPLTTTRLEPEAEARR